MRRSLVFTVWLCCGVAPAQTLNQTSGPWVMERSGTTAGLRGIHAVGGGVAWASGTNGTVLRTEDGGYEWQSCAMPAGAEKLDFRGIWAWDANTAIVMSSGPGDASRLYKTTDGCSSWKLVFTNPDKDGFWDAVAFWDDEEDTPKGGEEGFVLGDPVNGHFARFDLGRRGEASGRDPGMNAIAALPGEAAFAASNSSIAVGRRFQQGDSTTIWLGTGGRSGARVHFQEEHRTADFATAKWTSVAVPVGSQTVASGIFSLAFRDDKHGVAVGGDYSKPNESVGTAAWSADRGKTWTAAAKPPHGYRSAVAWDGEAKAWIAVGTNGSDISYDDGKTWGPLDDGKWNALSLPWVVGPQGRIAKLGRLPGRK